MRYTRTALSGMLGLGLAASLAAVPAAATGSTSPASTESVAAYTPGSAEDQANTRAFFEAVMESVKEKQAAKPGIQAVTVTYDASGAPTFAQEIANSTEVWNNAVDNVTLQEGSGGDFEYREGNDPRGSYASTDGHGHGYIFLDYAQNEEYDSNRVTSHETGHVLGLPDNYEGPCSELMSGGGPGPSCTNDQPNAQEAAQVEELWVNGLKELELAKSAFVKAH